MQTLTLEQFRATVDTGCILSVVLKAIGAGFAIQAETRRGDVVLVDTRKKQPRVFGDPRRALALLREMGIRKAAIDAVDWRPEQADLLRPSRPDKAAALKATHEAAAYDKWFRAEVEEAIKEADDPNTKWMSNEDAKKGAAKLREELLGDGRRAA